MEYRIVANGSNKYIECLPGINAGSIKGEQDALEWVALCGEEHIHCLMIHSNNLTQDFYQLQTGVAGAILQKFVTYSIKVAAILTPKLVNQGRFCEMVMEANRGRHFHVFYAIEEAELWLFRD